MAPAALAGGSNRFQHVVLFRFLTPLSAAEKEAISYKVKTWAGTVPGLTRLRFGQDVTGRSRGYDYLLLTEFADDHAHAAYYAHELHVAFSEWVFGRGCEVIRVDYPLTSETSFLEDSPQIM